MAKKSKAELQAANDRMAESTKSWTRMRLREREHNFARCAEIARLFPTGEDAAEAILRELVRTTED